MLTNTLKIFLAIDCLGIFFYSASVFGLSMAHFLLPAVSALVVASVFYKPLSFIVVILCKVIGVCALLALLLLLLAGTIGGSFNLSPSNQVIAGLLLGMSIFGLSSFFWASEKHEPR